MDAKDVSLKQKEAIRRRTRDVAARLAPELMDWRPEKDALSVGEILRHLWVSEQGVRRVALQGDFAYYEARIPRGLRAVLGTPEGLEAELAQMESVHQQTVAEVEAFPAARFAEERVHAGLGYRRRVYAILLGLNEHEVHHRAQLITYLRLRGAPVPEFIHRG